MCVIWGRAEGLVWPAIAFHRAGPGTPYQQWEEKEVEGHLGLERLADYRAAEVIGVDTGLEVALLNGKGGTSSTRAEAEAQILTCD